MNVHSPDLERLASQRVDGHARLVAGLSAGRSRITQLFQAGAAKIRMPRTGQDPFEAILVNTAGGLTGGDRLRWEIEVGAGASVAATTQASEKVYRSSAGTATLDVRLEVGAGGRLAWLPQETIAFDRSALERRLDVRLERGAVALVAEATVFGRAAMGEAVRAGSFRDRWRVSVDGRLVHAEDFRVGPEIAATLGRAAALGGRTAMATVLLVAEDAERHCEAARAIVGEAGGVSAWTVGGSGKLLARLACGDGYGLRKRLMPLLALLNGQAGLPKSWSL